MILPDEERTQYILDLLVRDNFDYVWFVETEEFNYEFHANENVKKLNIPDRGNVMEMLDSIRAQIVPENGLREYDKYFSVKRILRSLRWKGNYETKFHFLTGYTQVKIFLYGDRKQQLFVCARFLEDEELEDDEIRGPEALLIMELDQRKHFSIRNVNEGVAKVLGVSLLQFSEVFRHEAFAGYHPEDRLRAEQVFFENARDGAEFEDDFRLGVEVNLYKWIHVSVRVKKINKSFIYYVTIKKNTEKEDKASASETQNSENMRGKIHAFDVDLVKRTAHLGLEMKKYYNWNSTIEDFPEPFIRKKLIHPDDGEKVRNSLKSIMAGSMHDEYDLRVKNFNSNEYVWRRISFTTVFDDRGKAVRALGFSEDINYIKDQEERFHNVLEMCGFTTWDLNVEKRFITNAVRLKEETGLTDADLVNVPEGLIQAKAIHPEDIELIRDIHRQIEEGKKSVECEFRGRNVKSGKFGWLKLRYTTVTDENGKVLYAVGSAADINEQKIQELSYEYEAKTLYEMQGDTLVEKCSINATKDLVLNYAAKDGKQALLGKRVYTEDLRNIMKTGVNERTSRLIWDKLNPAYLLDCFEQGNKTFSFVYRRYTKTSNLQWVSTKVNMYQDPKTSDIICFIYTYDINRKKLSQEALELIGTADFDFVGIIDVIASGAIILHDNDIFSRVPNWDCGDYDAFFENYAERMRSNFDSEDDYKTFHDRIKISSLVHELQNAPSFKVLVKQHKKESGELQVFSCTFRYLDEERTSILFCMSDITSALAEEREREKVLKDALDQANIASRAKTDFLARMSHDIRTPLNGIMGMTQIAMEENDPDLIHSYLEKIDTSSHFLLGLLNDILDMSKVEQGVINLEEEVYSLSEFRENLDSIIVPLCRNKDIKLNVQIEGDCSFITDKQKFNQIFFNLLSNSVKFTEIGSTIDIIGENKVITEDRLEIDFVVRDYGCGMTEEFQKHMFEAFSQERNNVISTSAGTGLGLAIVKSLVEKMGGTIEVWSSVREEDHGTRTKVHFSLPLAK